jgi:multiple sugar transport system substrate-binding protein
MNSKLFFIFIAIFILLSCGKKEDAKNTGKTTIKVAHWFAENKDQWEEAVKEFEKIHPEIKVELESVVYQMYVQKLLTSSAANISVGDLLIIEDWFAQDLLERNYFYDLSDFVKTELDTSTLFTRAFGDYKNSKGELIGVPVALISTALFYNKDLFDQAGVKYPDSTWTYDDLLSGAQKITKDIDGDGINDSWGIQLNYSPLLDALLYSYGGGVLSADKNSSALSTPESIQALKFFVDLRRKYNVAAAPESAATTNTVPFLTGKFGMVVLPDFKTKFRNLKFKWDISLPPIGPKGRKAMIFSQAFGIPKESKNKKEAMIFLKWLINDLPVKYANFMEGLLHVNKKLANSPEYMNDEPKCNRKVSIDVQEKYSVLYLRPGYFELRDYGFQPEIEKAMNGRISVEDAAKEGAKKIDEIIKRNLPKNK